MGVPHLTLKVLILILGYASTQDPDCDFSRQVVPGSTYAIANNEYPSNYQPGVQCRWIAQCPSGYNCVLNCPDIDLPQTTSCSTDRLLISKSGDSQLSGAEYYCGRGTLNVVSTGQFLTVGLITSRQSPGGRFRCLLGAQPVTQPTCSCGYSKTMRIVGGNETGINEFPMMAGIVLDVSIAKIECGGVIIDNRYVLTAAHCLLNRDPKIMAIVVGEHDVTIGDSPATAPYRVEKYLVHPKFNQFVFDYDIALIRTANDMVFGPLVGPACLPFKYVNTDMTGKKLTALGWGTVYFGAPQSEVLRKVTLNVISQADCQKSVPTLTSRQICTYSPGKDACQVSWGTVYFGAPQSEVLRKVTLNVISQADCQKSVPTLTSRQICTYSPGKDACQDDSGGPLLYTDPSTNLLYNVAIISYGQLCALDNQPGVNTNVVEFLSWITSNTPGVNYCKK